MRGHDTRIQSKWRFSPLGRHEPTFLVEAEPTSPGRYAARIAQLEMGIRMLYGQEPPGLLNNPLGPTNASASVLMRGSPATSAASGRCASTC
jgi:hypothetical protein